jgi:RNA polymerase sigma factor (sigma-70 family)
MRSQDVDDEFGLAFDALATVAYRVAFRLLGSREEAEDIVQESLARAYARWRKVRGHAEPWIALVATNLALDHLRRSARRPVAELRPDEHDASIAADREAGLTIERIQLARLLEPLPKRQREVVVLRYLADLSEADTAAQLGTSVGSVKQHAHRGLAALRTAWCALDIDGLSDPVTEAGA